MIFGIPLDILDPPFLVSVFDMKTKFLYYYPKNSVGYINLNTPLSCTLLKFNIDWLTEYQDIGKTNKLVDREQKII